MTYATLTRTFGILCCAGLCWLGSLQDAWSASWQWSSQPGRERVDIRFDTPVTTTSATRVAENEVAVQLGTPGDAFKAAGPVAGKLVTSVSPDGNTLRVHLRDPAFGYVLSKPAPDRLRVDVFPDPLGARWQPSPGSGSLARTTPPAVSTPPPAQSQVPTTSVAARNTTRPAEATRPQANATAPAVPPNPAATDARTLGSATRPDGRGLAVLSGATTGRNGAADNAASGSGRNGSAAGTGNGKGNGKGAAPGASQQTGTPSPVQVPQAPEETAAPPPSVDDLSRMTSRIDKLPLNAMGSEQLRVPFSPLGAPPIEANATRSTPSASGPTPTGGLVETPLDEQGRPAAAGVSGRMTMQGLSGGVAVPSLGPSQAAPSTPPAPTTSAPAASAQAASGSADQTAPPSASQATSPAPAAPVPTTSAPTMSVETGPANTARLRARLNTNGPEAWPQERWLDAVPEAKPVAEAAPVKEEAAAQPPVPAEPPRVVYVDEKGNEVPKPPDSVAMIEEAQKLINTMQFQTARDMLEDIKTHVLTQEQREKVLYLLSDANYGLYANRWLEGYEPISISTSEAMNFNLKSPLVADALYRLGQLNLDVGNQQDALGYFKALKTKYPSHPSVPQGLYKLGKDQLDKQQYADAVRNFQTILDEYPENRVVREAARYMAEALYKQGHYERALILVDFVDRRWPRIYLEDPPYLLMVGDLQLRMRRYPEALQTLWTYYNLLPDTPENHKILLEIGNLYLRSGHDKGARDVFDELLRKYPKSPSAPMAILRLGEMTITPPNPTLDELFALFEKPGFTLPETAYRRILAEYPDAPEAEMAALRLLAWQFWNRETAEAMAGAAAFLEKYPSSPMGLRAETIIRDGFVRERALALAEENYERLLKLWETYPQVRIPEDKLDDDLRVALARAQLNRGAESEGMALLEPFLKRSKDPKYGEYVYNLKLAKLLREENWNGILDLGERIATWPMAPDMRNQLDYSLAISAENLGLPQKALPIWKTLYKRTDIPLYQKAYATYFLARDAERRKDLKDAYDLNLETLKLFTELEDERSDKADPERVRESLAALMDVTEVANRFAEALDWTDRYGRFVNEDSPDYAGLKFRQARLHRKMGDLARWRNLLEDIVRREPDSVFGRMASSELRTQEVARDLTRFAP